MKHVFKRFISLFVLKQAKWTKFIRSYVSVWEMTRSSWSFLNKWHFSEEDFWDYAFSTGSSVQFSRSVMSDSMWPHGLPGLPVHHQLPGFTQTHVHWVDDVIQPSHPLSSLSPTTFNLSQHQGLFKWVSFSHQVIKVLELQHQHQFFQIIFRTDFL